VIGLVADDDLVDFVGPEPGEFDWSVGENKFRELRLQFLEIP